MSKKCRAYSESKLGLEPADNRKAFYVGWEAAIKYVLTNDTSEKHVHISDKDRHDQPEPEPVAWLSKCYNDDSEFLGYTVWDRDVGEGAFPVYTNDTSEKHVHDIEAKLKEKNT